MASLAGRKAEIETVELKIEVIRAGERMKVIRAIQEATAETGITTNALRRELGRNAQGSQRRCTSAGSPRRRNGGGLLGGRLDSRCPFLPTSRPGNVDA